MINLKKSFEDALEFVNNKTCFVRCDLNLPYIDGKFSDYTRLDKAIPTIKEILLRNGKIILISHFGRPNGKFNEILSLKPIVPLLEKRLGKIIKFCDEDIKNSDKLKKKINKLDSGNVLLLENIRFYKEEEQNDLNFSRNLSSLADIYINESFSSSHRNHSSITGISAFLPSFPGKLFQYELQNLNRVVREMQKENSIAVLGGSKVSTKMKIIENLAKKFNKILIGGAMANTFLASQGINIGKSFCESRMLEKTNLIYKENKDKIILPIDCIVSKSENDESSSAVNIGNIKDDEYIFDIGPKTRKIFYNEILKHEKLLWNGPLGYFERKPFDNGTNYVSSIVNKHKSDRFFSIAGGGDTISALKNSGNINNFSFISTGGGAFLEYIEGKSLPGIEILNN